jgi:type II secretory pathway predicted ATPase ExeA
LDWSHFGMTRRPFRPAVDTGAYFPGAAHETALAAVTAAFARRDPVALVDGPPGTGKSLVARRWLERLPPDVPKVVLPNVKAPGPVDLFQAILFDLNLPYQGLSEQELRLSVSGQLLGAWATGHPTVLLIDEAQHLSPGTLEELRLLGNIETGDRSALFLLLVAQPALRAVLARPATAAFAQRVGARARVEPFTPEESAAYLRHQVQVAGGNPAAVLDPDAVVLLAGACGGVGRVLNQAAALAAELAADAASRVVDVEAALEALARLGLAAAEAEEPVEPVVLQQPHQPVEPVRSGGGKAGPGRPPGKGDHPQGARGSKQKAARKRSA